METLFYGTDYHSHLGTGYGGIAVHNKEFIRQIHSIAQNQFKSKFIDMLNNINGDKGIGVISAGDEQPIYLNSKLGPFCIVTNGRIENDEALARKLHKNGISFTEVSKKGVNNTELIGKMITMGKNIPDGIEKMFKEIKGSCSLLILTKNGIYAARDNSGHTPLIIGKRNRDWAVTTETTAFHNIGFSVKKELEPGEIVFVSNKGTKVIRKGNSCNQICSFLWIYTGFPASNYEGINAEVVRERCGRALARRDRDLKADIVSGVPDSGMAHAIGYAMESGKPLRRTLVKYTPGYGRSYVPPSQKTRDLVAKMKLVAIKDIIKGNRVVLCEDSIVRGTQLKNFTVKKLREAGAKEVHVRPACPPLMFPCKYNLSTRSINELVARKAIRSIEGKDIGSVSEYLHHKSKKYRKMIDWIASSLNVDSLKYQVLDDMVKAIGLPKDKICLYCWMGESPGVSKIKKAGKKRK
ncbi:amidophosphoribosyltransferase [Elusimicrobiota bacterium]